MEFIKIMFISKIKKKMDKIFYMYTVTILLNFIAGKRMIYINDTNNNKLLTKQIHIFVVNFESFIPFYRNGFF